jgi:phytoene/squalene synthetase
VLRAHCREAAAVHELLALAFDAGASAREHARTLGAAIVNARIVGAARTAAPRGSISLPLDLLAAAGLAPHALTGDWPPQALDLLARLGGDARVQLADALHAIPPAECPQLQPCLIMAALQDARLAALGAHRYEHTSDPLKPLSRLWIAWRAARRAMRSA